MNIRRPHVTILLLAVLFAVFFRLHAVAVRDTITHDEGISYLAATGHQKEYTELFYDHRAPYGQWVPASEWKRFIRPDEFFCFKKIGVDLAQFDIHPPLYFWILHSWVHLVGVHIWSGAMLNLIVSLFIMSVLYAVARWALSSRLEASVVAFIWAVNPYLIEGSTEARPYELLSLFTLILVWRILLYSSNDQRPSVRDAVLIAAITLVGALTHFHFALAVMGCSAIAAIRLWKHDRVRLLVVHASFAAGYLFFLLLHPRFLNSFSREQKHVEVFDFSQLVERLLNVGSSVAQFFVHKKVGEIPLSAFSIVFVVAVVVGFAAYRRTIGGSRSPLADRVSPVFFFLVWTVASVTLLYLLCFSPKHAMGAKYLVLAWPFLAIVTVLPTRLFPERLRRALLVAICAWQLFYAGAFATVAEYRDRTQTPPARILANADRVVVDSVARGVLPRIFWVLADEKEMFAADQNFMLEHEGVWMDRLTTGSMFISHPSYGNSEERQAEILSVVERFHRTSALPRVIYGYAFYQLMDKDE